jgi:iron complex transport system substrate-binding protein
MGKNKLFAIVAMAIVIIAAVGAIYVLTSNNPNNSAAATTVTDALGRTVAVPKQLDSIYCMGACSLRLVSYFDAVDKVHAVETAGTFNTLTDQTYYLVNKSTFSTLPQVATTAEALYALHPSLIITSLAEDAATADTLQAQTNCSVYVINANVEFGDAYYTQITSLGALLGEPSRAAELNQGVASMISDITSKVTVPSTQTAYACGMFYYGGASFLKGSGNYLPFDYSNITNAIEPAANKQPYTITLETLIAKNPDYIFVDSIGTNSCITAINGYIASNTGLEDVSAVKDGNLYSTMVYKCYGTNWDNQLINCYYVASVMNSNLYSWSFQDKANEVLHLFYPNTSMTYQDIAYAQTGDGCSKISL